MDSLIGSLGVRPSARSLISPSLISLSLSVQVNHPAYRLSSYSFSRSYRELSLFTLSLSLSLPSIIIPFLPFLPPPLSTSSQPNSSDLDSDLRSLRIQLSTWFNRLLINPLIFNHPELRSLIETEFSYLPSLNPSTSNLPSPISRKKLQNAIDLHQHGGSVNPLAIADLGYGYDSITTINNNSSSSSLPGGIGMGSSVMNQLFSSSSSNSIGSGKMGTSRNVFDDDELLVAARAEVTRLELQFKDAGQAIGKRSIETLSLSSNLHQLSNKFLNLYQVEELRPASVKVGFPKGLEVVGRGVAIEGVGDEREVSFWGDFLSVVHISLELICNVFSLSLQSSLDLHHLSHALLYQSLNARSAKEALLTRNALVEEHHSSTKSVISKRREIDMLRSSRSIRRDRVDEKVEELEDAIRLEKILNDQLKFLSKSLSSSLQNHSRETHKDLMESLKKHSMDRLKTNKEILLNLKVMKEGVGRIGKDWNAKSNLQNKNGGSLPPGGMVRNISGTGSNGYGYQQQSIETNAQQQQNLKRESLDSSRSSPSSSVSTVVAPPVPISAYEGGTQSPIINPPQLSRESSSSGQDSSQQNSFMSPQQRPQPPSNFSSPSTSSSILNPQFQNQTPPRPKPNPWAPEGHNSPSNSFNQSPSTSFNRDSMNQSWYANSPSQQQYSNSNPNQNMSKSMFVERPSPPQQSQSQSQESQQQWNGMPTSSSFASRFGTLGNRNPSTGGNVGGSSFGSGASAYGNPFTSSGSSSSGNVQSNPNAPRSGINSGGASGLNSGGGGGSFGSQGGGLNRSRISASDAAKQLAGRF